MEIITGKLKRFNSIIAIAAKWHKYIKNFPNATTIYTW